MVHGKVEINYNLLRKERTFIYIEPTGERHGGVFLSSDNSSFELERIGTRTGDTYRTSAGKELHCCGAQGFGQEIEDVCPSCEVTRHSFTVLKDLVFLLEGGDSNGIN
ncbi:hypothetical protein H8D91_01475 [archaeon]|nr:hypothetical protein [archaeon]